MNEFVYEDCLIVLMALVCIQLSRKLLRLQFKAHGVQRPLHDVMHTKIAWSNADLFSSVASQIQKGVIVATVWLCWGRLRQLVPEIGLMYCLRAVMNSSTLLPPPTSCRHNTNVIIDILREANNCGDLMFSGHQGITMLMLFMLRDNHLISSTTLWTIAVIQGVCTISSRNHYSIDVIVALMATYIIHYNL
jgi:membrane-associated phospholipid phosphatase